MWDNLTALQLATVKEIQMQIAALHQRPDQPAGGPGAGGPHPMRIGAMKLRPPHNLTPLPGYPPLLLSVPQEGLLIPGKMIGQRPAPAPPPPPVLSAPAAPPYF
jgi:hypothetical protein